MLPVADRYEEIYQAFKWPQPGPYNVAFDVVDRHAAATPNAPALIFEQEDGTQQIFSFGDIQRASNRFANTLKAHGVKPGQRVAVQLSQSPEMAIAFVAIWKLGALFIPISVLFGEDALSYRLIHGDAVALVTDRVNFPKFAAIRDQLPDVTSVFLADGAESGAMNFWDEAAKASDAFQNAATHYNDPAFMAYTSGTTGQPKGALHAHSNLIGHMPCHDFAHEYFGQEGDLSWSPADWAWMGGLMDVLMPAWFHGKPVLAYRAQGPFDPEKAYHMMAKYQVRNTLLMPTMLKMMRQIPNPPELKIRTIMTGGEPVGTEIIDWARNSFGASVNEIFGQTECNFVLTHVAKYMPARFGSMGKPVPGHIVSIVDDEGQEVGPDTEGHIAIKRPDPVMLIEYWKNPEATREKFIGDWLITGDAGRKDEEGYFWFLGRTDDVISSAGYRIGPGEIEDCLQRHPAVALAAAVGIPDPARTEIIKAFIVPVEGVAVDEELEVEIRSFVRSRLAKHEYPREIEFIKEMPTTTTGKVMRRVLKQQDMEKKGLV